MTKAFKRERERIRRVAAHWQPVLGLEEWDLTTAYVDGQLLVDGALNPDAAATASTRWEYRTATIQFNLEKTAQLSYRELEEVYIHEAMHLLLNELREEDHDLKHEEHAATTLTNILLRLTKRPPTA